MPRLFFGSVSLLWWLQSWVHEAHDENQIYRLRMSTLMLFWRFAASATVDGECYNPEWEVHENQNSWGASQYEGPQSVQECLDHCGSQGNCVAVDVDLTQQPPTCWPHFSNDDSNVFSQPGTNQYRLIERCARGPITGFWFNSIISLLL